MNQATLSYLSELPRDGSAAITLRALCEVLRDFGDSEQLRSLAFETGRSLAREHPLGDCPNLEAFAEAADAHFRTANWGTLQVSADGEAVDFQHGAPPLKAWFGADHGDWCYGIFEGVLSEWLQQMGADETLELRHLPDDTDDAAQATAHYRFAHHARLRSAKRGTA